MVKRGTHNARSVGSIPTGPTKIIFTNVKS